MGNQRVVLSSLMLFLGMVTIGSQILLIREFFSILYGSDTAVALTLASWMLFSGIGALAAEAAPPFRRHTPLLGFALYPVIVLCVLLGIRWWGHAELTGFTRYLQIPIFLGPPCLLGGTLFPWAVNWLAPKSPEKISRAYADETLGAVNVSLILAVYFFFGGESLPVIICFAAEAIFICLLPFPIRFPRVLIPGIFIALLLTAFYTNSGTIDRFTLRLRYPDYTVLEHQNTPFGSLTALKNRQGDVFVFDNGVPCPLPDNTYSKKALTGLITQIPADWNRVLIIGGSSAGFGKSLNNLRGGRFVHYERDRYKLEFLDRWQSGFSSPPSDESILGGSLWKELARNDYDLIVHFAQPPGSLLLNQFLTREFFAEAAERLTSGGAIITLLPMAPGFMHPAQQKYVQSIRNAMDKELRSVTDIETDWGYLIVIASERAPDLTGSISLQNLKAHFANADPVVKAEIENILRSDPGLRIGPEIPSENSPANSVLNPSAYFAYLHFRARFVEEIQGFWLDIFSKTGLYLPVAVLLVLLVIIAQWNRGNPWSAGLFWNSWVLTMCLMYGIYICQSTMGQAYWLVTLLVTASMTGIFLGAAGVVPGYERLGPIISSAFLISLFPAYESLRGLNAAGTVAVLMCGIGSAGVSLGNQFRKAARSGGKTQPTAARLFCLDLLGGTLGLTLGAVLLPWWIGFGNAALLCALPAIGYAWRE